MKKLSYYLLLTVIAGIGLISFWGYQKYFKTEAPKFLLFPVERGSLQEIVKVRGEVVTQKDFDLEFPFSGIIESVFVKEGQPVSQGDPLIKLETIDFQLEKQNLEALLAQKQANLEKLLAGATPEDIRVAETKVKNAETALEDAKKNVVDKLQDAYTKGDDGVRNRTDQLFNSPRSSNPQLNFTAITVELENALESERLALETLLVSWKTSLNSLTVESDLDSYIKIAKVNLNRVKSYLDNTALAVSALTPATNLTQTTIDNYRSDVSTGRTNVNTATVNLSTAEEKLRGAESDLTLKQKELDLKKAGTRTEDIKIAKAQIEEVNSQIAITKEKIRKSVLYAPVSAKVIKVWLEKKEFFRVGQTAIALSTSANKIQADVSELDIGKVRETNGNETIIQLDAFPSQEFKGKVVSVDPKEIIKEGDKYYRINVYLEKEGGVAIRSGMSADLKVLVSFKESVLKIPEMAVLEKNGGKFVKILDGEQKKEVEIKTGISDGEFVEITSGLTEGQTVVVAID